MFWVYLILFFPIYYGLRYLWELIPVGSLKKRAVFISGCDTGFGRLLALKCTENDIPVFAGCYTKQVSTNCFVKNETEVFRAKKISKEMPRDLLED